MLLGLARATSGSMKLFGTDVPHRLPEVIGRIGAVVESPKFSPNFTGRQNLQLLARTIGVAESRVDAALETVSLTGRDRDRYRGYSLGMKQRLAIAATLLKDPQLLILDEPTNGLDPAGIREIRETIRTLGLEGVTVLLSSHILAEVQQVCDSVTIIGHGRMLASGRVDDLVGVSTAYRITLRELGTGLQVLANAGFAVRREGEELVVDTDAPPEELTRRLAEEGHYLSTLVPVRGDLESVFLELTASSTLGHGSDVGLADDATGEGSR
jgi:ABC-2 type transport system ATP-binding protein